MFGGPLRVWWSKTGKYPCTSGVSLHMGALTNPKSELQSGSWGVLELGLDHGVNASMSMRPPQVGSKNVWLQNSSDGANRQVLGNPCFHSRLGQPILDFRTFWPPALQGSKSLETDPGLAASEVASLKRKAQLP